MKRSLFLLLITCLLTALFCCFHTADAETYGDLTYLVSNGEVTITDCSTSATSVTIPETINGYTVTSIGEWAFSRCTSLTSIVIPDSVTSIGDRAFVYCDSLTSVFISDIAAWCNISFNGAAYSNPLCYAENLYLNGQLVTDLVIPDGVTSIGYRAFYNCSGLTSIVIPDSVTRIGSHAFYSCDSLASVVIGDSVTSIGSHAFYYCDSLTSIVIPDSVTSIGERAFEDCTSLEIIVIPDSVTSIGQSFIPVSTTINCPKGSAAHTYALENTRHFVCTDDGWEPEIVHSGSFANNTMTWKLLENFELRIIGIGNMPNWANKTFVPWHEHENKIRAAKISEGITSLNRFAFIRNSCLAIIDIPDSVTSIGENVFFGCSNLTSVDLGDSVTSIGDGAFWGCSLASIEIPGSVTSIGENAFHICRSLMSIVVDSDNQYYSNDEYGVLFNKNKTTLIQYPIGNTRQTYTIPDSVTSIGNSAFYECNMLKSVDIPDSVVTIGDEAFAYCRSLASIDVGNSVTSISNKAFMWCGDLTSVVIPDSVTSIGNKAFYACDRFVSIVIPTGVTRIDEDAFYGCDNLTIYGYSDSYAQSYAEENDIPFVITGGNCGENVTWKLIDGVLTISGEGDMKNYATVEDTPWYENRESVTSIVFETGVTSISPNAFIDFDKVKEIKIPHSVTRIGENAFSSCDGIEKVIIGRGVTHLPDDVFGNCFNLKEVTIPKNVISISDTAFRHVFNFVINAPAGSYAQTYAQEKGHTFNEIPNANPGDVTSDGTVNRQDLLRLAKYFAGWDVELDEAAADVTGDGSVNRQDLLRLAKYFAGWDVTLGE